MFFVIRNCSKLGIYYFSIFFGWLVIKISKLYQQSDDYWVLGVVRSVFIYEVLVILQVVFIKLIKVIQLINILLRFKYKYLNLQDFVFNLDYIKLRLLFKKCYVYCG